MNDIDTSELAPDPYVVRAEVKIIHSVLAQLRHAYAQLNSGSVVNQREFAEGLLSPQIRKLEMAVNWKSPEEIRVSILKELNNRGGRIDKNEWPFTGIGMSVATLVRRGLAEWERNNPRTSAATALLITPLGTKFLDDIRHD